jgi:signal transduction histidine kinase
MSVPTSEKAARSMGAMPKPRMPFRYSLTFVLPAALSGAIFLATLAIAAIGVSMIHAANNAALENKASVFLDGLAGHVAPLGAITDDAAYRTLIHSLSHQSVLGEEAVAVGWRQADGSIRVLSAPDNRDQARLLDLVDNSLRQPAGHKAFEIDRDARATFTKTYRGEEQEFALAALFDARAVVDANWAALQSAAAISLVLAALAAGLSFFITRKSVEPLRAFTERLANPASVGGSASLAHAGLEVAALETALSLRQQNEQARARTLEELAQSERDALLARLAATLAHEVRNPLAGILNALSTLRSHGHEASARIETITIAEAGLESLRRIADVTLATYRRRDGRTTIHASDIRDLRMLIAPDAERGGITLLFDVDDGLALTLDADALRQILVNLLLNACRATPTGGQVTLRAEMEDGAARIAVTDTGPGMPGDVLALLRAGSKTEIPPTRELGVWIVSTLVDEIGATINVSSQHGQGTTVTLVVPNASLEKETGHA